jgi:hypothetical protein
MVLEKDKRSKNIKVGERINKEILLLSIYHIFNNELEPAYLKFDRGVRASVLNSAV